MTTRPCAPMASTAARVLLSPSLSGELVREIVYIGTPWPPSLVISAARASSARLRAATSRTMTAATTLAPRTCMGLASGSRKVVSKMWLGGLGGPLAAQPPSISTAAPARSVRLARYGGNFIGAMTTRPGTAVSGTFVLEARPLEEGADVELEDVGFQLVQRFGTRRQRLVGQYAELAQAERGIAEIVVGDGHVVVAQVDLALAEPGKALDLEFVGGTDARGDGVVSREFLVARHEV